MAEEICHLASIDSDLSANQLSEAELVHLYHTFSLVMEDVRDGNFHRPLSMMRMLAGQMPRCTRPT